MSAMSCQGMDSYLTLTDLSTSLEASPIISRARITANFVLPSHRHNLVEDAPRYVGFEGALGDQINANAQ